MRAIVVGEQNAHGALMVQDPGTNATYHVVENVSPELRDGAKRLVRGTAVEIELSRAGIRANIWRAMELSVPIDR